MDIEVVRNYTEEKYATKKELEIAFPLLRIEQIWLNIINYRSYFEYDTGIIGPNEKTFTINLNRGLIARLNRLNQRITQILLSENNPSNQTDLAKKSLKEIARSHNLGFSDKYFEELLTGQVVSMNREQIPLVNYASALKNLFNLSLTSFSISDITKVASFLLLEDQESVKFRSHDLDTTNPSFLQIEKSLNSLIIFNNNLDFPIELRILITYIILLYVKPFNFNNEEIALLISKYLASFLYQTTLAVNLPFESILNIDEAIFLPLIKEALSTNDLTYPLIAIIDYLLDKLFKINLLQAPLNVEQTPIQNDSTIVVREELLSREENADSKQEITYIVDVALPTIPVGYSNSESERLVFHLLEVDPKLKKMEARFYAFHCTKGKYYTISQFKHYNNCVYETARTSMDNLVLLGYYSKAQVKNKFVYTPIDKRRDK